MLWFYSFQNARIITAITKFVKHISPVELGALHTKDTPNEQSTTQKTCQQTDGHHDN